MNIDDYDVLECDTRPTALGEALHVRLHRKDMAPMPFRELWDVFDHLYPGLWAVQVFPPRVDFIDQVNKYHLFVLLEGDEPRELNLMRRPPRGTLSRS